MPHGPNWKPDKYTAIEQALGSNLGEWIDAKRCENQAPGDRATSWQDIAYDIRTATGLKVTHETLRTWWTLWITYERDETR